MKQELINKLVPAELLDGYTIERGIIQNPGKFEGESVATLYYYDAYLNGDGSIMEISQDERNAFEIGPAYTHVYLYESEQGFAHLYFCTSLEQAEQMDSEDSDGDWVE